jgi:dolichyl-phosphate-mannose--protein O-mannosyl transferase
VLAEDDKMYYINTQINRYIYTHIYVYIYMYTCLTLSIYKQAVLTEGGRNPVVGSIPPEMNIHICIYMYAYIRLSDGLYINV